MPDNVAFISNVAAIDIDFEPSAVCVTTVEADPNLVVTPPVFRMAGILEIVVFAPLIVMVAALVPMYKSYLLSCTRYRVAVTFDVFVLGFCSDSE